MRWLWETGYIRPLSSPGQMQGCFSRLTRHCGHHHLHASGTLQIRLLGLCHGPSNPEVTLGGSSMTIAWTRIHGCHSVPTTLGTLRTERRPGYAPANSQSDLAFQEAGCALTHTADLMLARRQTSRNQVGRLVVDLKNHL